jgi:hypothetical protein
MGSAHVSRDIPVKQFEKPPSVICCYIHMPVSVDGYYATQFNIAGKSRHNDCSDANQAGIDIPDHFISLSPFRTELSSY